jgi:Flp pilus assembly protein TadD
MVLLEEKKYSEAERSFRRALERDDRMAEAWNGLGVACAGAGRDDEAVDAWKRAVALDATEFDAMLNLSLLLRRLHRESEEADYLRQFLEGAPPDYRVEREKARARLAEMGHSVF